MFFPGPRGFPMDLMVRKFSGVAHHQKGHVKTVYAGTTDSRDPVKHITQHSSHVFFFFKSGNVHQKARTFFFLYWLVKKADMCNVTVAQSSCNPARFKRCATLSVSTYLPSSHA